MIRVVVGGATGRLGRIVCGMICASDDMELVGAVVSPYGDNVGRELHPGVFGIVPADISEVLAGADVYVDLTSPQAAAEIIADILGSGVNIVLGTTAVPADVISDMEGCIRRNGTSAVISANFAVGVNVFWSVAERMSEMLRGFQIDITETHRAGKVDSPSGTAMETLRLIRNATGIDGAVYGDGTDGDGICVQSVRIGDVVGDHTVMFTGRTERLELTHNAISREAFADGCLACIRWIHGKKDGRIHGMREVLGI